MKTILYFHQSAELYGSDKTLLQLIIGMIERGHRVIVIVPNEGPLTTEFKNFRIKYIVTPILKLSRDMFTPKNIFLFVYHLFKSTRKIRKKTKNLKIDCVHSNTLAVLLGALYAKLFRIKHIWHVHEIIQHPKIVYPIYSFLLRKFSSTIVFNSNATANYWKIKNTNALQFTIHNGIESISKDFEINEIREFKKRILNINSESIVITLIGRISRLKGQKLLLSAFENANFDKKDCVLLYVGESPLGQEYYQTELEQLIKESSKADLIRILPHQKNIEKIYAISDIIIVPSTEPESFGMTALEAMIAKRPVIVAGHGGLLEIVEHNETGLIFEVSNEKALRTEILRLINDKDLRNKLVKNAREKAINEFPIGKYLNSFEDIYTNNC